MRHRFHRLDFRLCIVRHFEDQPDMRIKVLGPYHPKDFPAAIEQYLDLSQWQRMLPEPEMLVFSENERELITYGQAMTRDIANAYAAASTYLNNTLATDGIDGRSYGMMALPGGCFSWAIAGRIEKSRLEPANYVAEQIQKELANSHRPEDILSEEPKPKQRKGLSGFLLPPVWIDSAPKVTLKARLEGVHLALPAHRKIILRTASDGVDLAVTQSGCLCLAVEDRVLAADVLNGIFSALLVLGQPAFSVSPTDLIVQYKFNEPFTSYSFDEKVRAEQTVRLEGEPA